MAFEVPKEFAARKDELIDHDQKVSRWGSETLDPVVKVHEGTVRRDDSSTSCEDGDSRSGSTDFDAPNPLRKTCQYSKEKEGICFERGTSFELYFYTS